MPTCWNFYWRLRYPVFVIPLRDLQKAVVQHIPMLACINQITSLC